MTGIGRQAGRLHPEYGPGIALLKCDNEPCGATWVDPIDTPCPWCLEAIERQKVWQAELTLKPPDVDPADSTYDGAMRAWRQRLKVAVQAGLITEMKAKNAWDRAKQ